MPILNIETTTPSDVISEISWPKYSSMSLIPINPRTCIFAKKNKSQSQKFRNPSVLPRKQSQRACNFYWGERGLGKFGGEKRFQNFRSPSTRRYVSFKKPRETAIFPKQKKQGRFQTFRMEVWVLTF